MAIGRGILPGSLAASVFVLGVCATMGACAIARRGFDGSSKGGGSGADPAPPELVLCPKVSSVPQARVEEDHVTDCRMEHERRHVRRDAIEGPWRVAVGARTSVQRVIVVPVVLPGSEVHRRGEACQGVNDWSHEWTVSEAAAASDVDDVRCCAGSAAARAPNIHLKVDGHGDDGVVRAVAAQSRQIGREGIPPHSCRGVPTRAVAAPLKRVSVLGRRRAHADLVARAPAVYWPEDFAQRAPELRLRVNGFHESGERRSSEGLDVEQAVARIFAGVGVFAVCGDGFSEAKYLRMLEDVAQYQEAVVLEAPQRHVLVGYRSLVWYERASRTVQYWYCT